MNDPEFDEKYRNLIDNIYKEVIQISQLLKGYNGNKGLCERHEDLATDYYKFKRQIFLVVGILIGSGVLGVGIYQIAQAMITR